MDTSMRVRVCLHSLKQRYGSHLFTGCHPCPEGTVEQRLPDVPPLSFCRRYSRLVLGVLALPLLDGVRVCWFRPCLWAFSPAAQRMLFSFALCPSESLHHALRGCGLSSLFAAFALPFGSLRSGGRLNFGQPCSSRSFEHFLWAALVFGPVRGVIPRTTPPGKPLRVACSLNMSVGAATVKVGVVAIPSQETFVSLLWALVLCRSRATSRLSPAIGSSSSCPISM